MVCDFLVMERLQIDYTYNNRNNEILNVGFQTRNKLAKKRSLFLDIFNSFIKLSVSLFPLFQ